MAKPLWVFGYGSLMWNPGFEAPRSSPARLYGYHRALCIHSEHYRGTPSRPGIILGLLPGGSCCGIAHRLPARRYDAVRRYLWRREIENDGVYREAVRPIRFADGSSAVALVYLADRDHRQFAGRLPLAKTLRLVRQGQGVTGSNMAYLRNTLAHLRDLGLRDPALEKIAGRLGA